MNIPCRSINQIIQNDNVNLDQDESQDTPRYSLQYDLEWLAILQKTNHWLSTQKRIFPDPDISQIHISSNDVLSIRLRLKQKYYPQHNVNDEKITNIPNNFMLTLQPHGSIGSNDQVHGGRMVGNPQTDALLDLLGLEHVVTVPYVFASGENAASTRLLQHQHHQQRHHTNVHDTNEIDIDDEDDNKVDEIFQESFNDANEVYLDSE